MIIAIALALAEPGTEAFVDAQMGPIKTALWGWLQCQATTERRYSTLNERADILADAVMGACSAHEARMKVAFLGMRHRDGSPMYRSAEVDRMITDDRAKYRNQVLSDIIEDRAKPVTGP